MGTVAPSPLRRHCAVVFAVPLRSKASNILLTGVAHFGVMSVPSQSSSGKDGPTRFRSR